MFCTSCVIFQPLSVQERRWGWNKAIVQPVCHHQPNLLVDRSIHDVKRSPGENQPRGSRPKPKKRNMNKGMESKTREVSAGSASVSCSGDQLSADKQSSLQTGDPRQSDLAVARWQANKSWDHNPAEAALSQRHKTFLLPIYVAEERLFECQWQRTVVAGNAAAETLQMCCLFGRMGGCRLLAAAPTWHFAGFCDAHTRTHTCTGSAQRRTTNHLQVKANKQTTWCLIVLSNFSSTSDFFFFAQQLIRDVGI